MKYEPTRVEVHPAFTLAGISVVTTNEAELSGEGRIGKLFERYYSRDMGSQLAPYAQRQDLYNCYFNYEQGDAGRYEVLVGVSVREPSQEPYPESVTTFTVPAAKYAVFVTERGPVFEVVQRAWSGIWQWSRQPGNERAFTGDFELYPENTNPNDGQVEIYIALRE
ncbi:MAG: GyrI-like domain-containing protein [Cohnella sp.]|nr:GyrI-like domain-containing protein [Cohnella sp.]